MHEKGIMYGNIISYGWKIIWTQRQSDTGQAIVYVLFVYLFVFECLRVIVLMSRVISKGYGSRRIVDQSSEIGAFCVP